MWSVLGGGGRARGKGCVPQSLGRADRGGGWGRVGPRGPAPCWRSFLQCESAEVPLRVSPSVRADPPDQDPALEKPQGPHEMQSLSLVRLIRKQVRVPFRTGVYVGCVC